MLNFEKLFGMLFTISVCHLFNGIKTLRDHLNISSCWTYIYSVFCNGFTVNVSQLYMVCLYVLYSVKASQTAETFAGVSARWAGNKVLYQSWLLVWY